MNKSPFTTSNTVRYTLVGLALLMVVAMTAGAIYTTRQSSAAKKTGDEGPSSADRYQFELVKNMPHTIEVPERVRKGLNVEPTIPASAPTQTRPLVMPGSTSMDPGRLKRIRTRFNAEVVQITQVTDEFRRSAGHSVLRELRPGDIVRKGEVLAIVWSIDVGSRKSDLVDALVQLHLDEIRLKAREDLYAKGSLPLDVLLQTRHDVVSDRNAKERAERTLRTWNIPEREIQAVYDEAELASARMGKRNKEKERLWARSELLAPCDGTVVERNVSIGEYVADNTVNLFTIAEVDQMLVIANPPEDQLPVLLALSPATRRWKLETVGSPPIEGPIEEIGYIVDANQHTAVVKGYIENPQGTLRAGQYVTATVDLPPPPDVVEVPLTALAEDGKQSFVFVQPDPAQPRYTMRRVQVAMRFDKTAFIRSRLTPAQEKLTPAEAAQSFQPPQPLKQGERIIPSGVLELRAALEDLESKADHNR